MRQRIAPHRHQPRVVFKAEGDTDSFNNVNFAYSRAVEMANETGKPVKLLSNGMTLNTINPKKS